MQQHHITVSKTARYYTAGELTVNTKTIWLVVHGFAQRAEEFIQDFSFLNESEHFIIAPEALNRFYKKGTSGDTAATWMTKDDRENEIKDYVNYLNDLYDYCIAQVSSSVQINVLGFSQGSATVSRWMVGNKRKVDKLIFYAGEIGREIIEANRLNEFHASEKYFVCGTQDPIIPSEMVKQLATLTAQYGLSFKSFEGGHEINKAVILGL